MIECRQEFTMAYQSGRQFLQIPGPTNVPERVLRALSRPTIDHRGQEFGLLAKELLETYVKLDHPASSGVTDSAVAREGDVRGLERDDRPGD